MKVKAIYPYQNLSLEDMEGEVWDDIPDFDGAYHVSIYGRIKSLRRWRKVGYGSGYYTKDRILQTRLVTSFNNHLKENTFSLGVCLKHEGKVRSISVARLVYYVFVEQFDIDNPELIISYKDGDGRNVIPGNLILSNRSEVAKRSYKLKRTYSHWEENKLPVQQLTMSDKLIRTYTSITEAAQKTGFNLGAIADCTKGNLSQHKGYKWLLLNGGGTAQTKKKDELFNHNLWVKIGKPKTSKKDPIPALNLSKQDLKNEIWKPIDGLISSYAISSLGRAKSIGRFKANKVWLKEHILKLVAHGNKNRAASSLLACLNKDGRKYQQSVARLVYYHFVEKFDLSNKAVRIRCKDNCFYNLHYGNLERNRLTNIFSKVNTKANVTHS